MLFLRLFLLAGWADAMGQGGAGCDYCSLDPANTYCLYSGAGLGAGCGPVLTRGVANQERALLLEAHNRYRSRVSAFYKQNQLLCLFIILNALRLIIPAEPTFLVLTAGGRGEGAGAGGRDGGGDGGAGVGRGVGGGSSAVGRPLPFPARQRGGLQISRGTGQYCGDVEFRHKLNSVKQRL